MGVCPGETVAFMDWDSHRYLEACFAVPMLGAVLQTVNVRLATDQILYTLEHAEASVLIYHADFVPQVATMLHRLPKLGAVLEMCGEPEDIPVRSTGHSNYEDALAQGGSGTRLPDFTEDAVATTFYTTGTTGLPKAVCFTHRQLVLHALMLKAPQGWRSPVARQGRGLHAPNADVSCPRLGLPLCGDPAWRKTNLSRSLRA